MSRTYIDVLVEHLQESIANNTDNDKTNRDIIMAFSESIKVGFDITDGPVMEELIYYIEKGFRYDRIYQIICNLKTINIADSSVDLKIFREHLNSSMSSYEINMIFEFHNKNCLKYLMSRNISDSTKCEIKEKIEKESEFDYKYNLTEGRYFNSEEINCLLVDVVFQLSFNEHKKFLYKELKNILKDFEEECE